MNRVKDVFDKRMDRPVWEKVWPLYDKHREFVLYSFFGMGTFLVSVCTYYFFTQTLGLNALVANVYSWMFAVLFAFLTNRVWVFQAPTQTWGEFVKQAVGFYSGRFFTLLVEEAILVAFLADRHCNQMAVKLSAQIVVIILNYIFSKLIIFRKKELTES